MCLSPRGDLPAHDPCKEQTLRALHRGSHHTTPPPHHRPVFRASRVTSDLQSLAYQKIGFDSHHSPCTSQHRGSKLQLLFAKRLIPAFWYACYPTVISAFETCAETYPHAPPTCVCVRGSLHIHLPILSHTVSSHAVLVPEPSPLARQRCRTGPRSAQLTGGGTGLSCLHMIICDDIWDDACSPPCVSGQLSRDRRPKSIPAGVRLPKMTQPEYLVCMQ